MVKGYLDIPDFRCLIILDVLLTVLTYLQSYRKLSVSVYNPKIWEYQRIVLKLNLNKYI